MPKKKTRTANCLLQLTRVKDDVEGSLELGSDTNHSDKRLVGIVLNKNEWLSVRRN